MGRQHLYLEVQAGWGSKHNGSLERDWGEPASYRGISQREGLREVNVSWRPGFSAYVREGQGDCPGKHSPHSRSHGLSGAVLGSLGFE